ncbi:hypothetical protein N7533_012871 [Penicillium manginii]|uniref:uncharacterized protein n=1 Tax=Penicillium manginii TaxID=203109 RepID=UPI00254775A5|nr:uncharacterized protein N7533_012871 [Penicillium manginii]KAJ5740087.1 hypothetical protein N7533_012871 [Penicillium manginii]
MVDTSEQIVHRSKVANLLDPRVANNVENKDIREAEEGAIGPHNTNNLKKTLPDWGTEQRQDTPPEHLSSARHYGKGGASGPYASNIINKIDPRVNSGSKDKGADRG